MMNTTSHSAFTLSHDEISRRAQTIWADRGHPSGQDEDIWFEAERQLAKEQQTALARTPVTVVEAAAATGTRAPTARVKATRQRAGKGK